MKWLKALFAILGLFIIVCVIAISLLMYFVDPNKLKPALTNEVMKRTGYYLAIDGKLSWSFYPRVGVKVDRLTLRSPNEKKPFAELRGVNIATELSQLLQGNNKLQGDVYVADMRLMNLHLENLETNISWQNEILTLRSIRAKLYDGTLEAVLHGQNLAATPRWEWDAQFNHVQLKPLLQDINGANSKLQIAANGQVKMKGVAIGKTKAQLFSNLDGNVEFNLDHGVVQGIDLNYYVHAADALLNRQPVPAPDGSNQTTFNSLTGSAIIRDGIAETNNLLLVSPAFMTNGSGKIRLLDETANLQLQIKPQQNIRTQWEVPVIITGKLSQPDIRLDVSEIERLVAKQQIERVKDKANALIEKNVKGKAKDFLQNLIGK